MATRARKPLHPGVPSKTLITKQGASSLNLSFGNLERGPAAASSSQQPSGLLDLSSDPWCLDSGWEVIVYRQAQGQPRLSIGRLRKGTCVVEQGFLHLVYQSWQPLSRVTRKVLAEQPVDWVVDQTFTSSLFHLEIFGRTTSGKPFVFPSTYTFNGATASSALKQQQQRQEYILQQRARFRAAHSTPGTYQEQPDPGPAEVVLTQGNPLESATLAFNTAGELPVVSAVKLSVPIIAGAGHDDASAGSTSAAAAVTQPESRAPSRVQNMATDVVSVVSASPSAATEAGGQGGQSAASTTNRSKDTDAVAATSTVDLRGATQRPAAQQHDGGVLEPPQTSLQETRHSSPAGAASARPSKHHSVAPQATDPSQSAHQALSSTQLPGEVLQPQTLSSAPQQDPDNYQALQNGKRHHDSAGLPRNGKLPDSSLHLHTDPEQQGRQQPANVVRRSTDGGHVARDSSGTHLARIAVVAQDADSLAGAASSQRQSTPPGTSPRRLDVPAVPVPTRNYAGSSNSLDSYGSSHSSMHGGPGRGQNSGQRWGGQQQQHGGHQGGGMAKDRKTSRGSYGNLQSATGSMGGGKHYHGRNGAYGSSGQQQGRMVMLQQGGGSSRVSMDDMLLGPQGQGSAHARGIQRAVEMGGSNSLSGVHDMQQGLEAGTSPEPTATTDLERLLAQVTPMINVDCVSRPAADALQALCLEDVWRFYLEASLYGREVYTLGGARGPSLSYYVPYLSAMQLFTPASPKDTGSQRLYISDTDGWPKHMHLRYEIFESELPFNRHPLYEALETLSKQMADAEASFKAGSQQLNRNSQPAPATPEEQAASQPPQPEQPSPEDSSTAASGTAGGSEASGSQQVGEAGEEHAPDSTAGTSPPDSTPVGDPPAAEGTGAAQAPPAESPVERPWLQSARISELHPASWYCVAWYPVYRVPDAPLNTRFLTFHSFAPLVASIQNALGALREGQQRPLSVLPMTVVGLKWNNMHGERWLEPIASDGPPGSMGSLARHDEEPTSSYGGGRSGGRRSNYGQRAMDSHFQAHLSELQGTAERLARGHGVRVLGPMGVEDYRQRHPDYEFFNSRG